MVHDRLKKELDRAKAALEEAFMQKAEATLWRRTTAEELARMFGEAPAAADDTGGDVARDHKRLTGELKQLEAESARAGELLKRAQRRQYELEKAVRAADAEAARQRARTKEACARLREQADALFAQEQQYLKDEYGRTFAELQRLNRMRDEAEARYERERAVLDAQIARTRAHLEAEAKRVQQSWDRAKRTARGRVRHIRNQRQNAEQKIRARTEGKLQAERQRLEGEIALALAEQEKAQQELARTESARRARQEEVRNLKRGRRKPRSPEGDGRSASTARAGAGKADADERAARERAVNAELRLRLQEERAAWLRKEQAESQADLDKAHKYAQAMERMSSKTDDSETQGMQLFEDIQAQLEEDDGEAYARQRLSLARSAHEQAQAELERTRRSLEQVQARITRAKK